MLACFCMFVLTMDTRTDILLKNYEAVRLNGYQGLRPDKEVADMGLTKGALYHHFENKIDLAYAIFDELILPRYLLVWKAFSEAESGFGGLLKTTLESYLNWLDEDKPYLLGCALTNLTQEMVPLDEGFRQRIKRTTLSMQQMIEVGIKNAQLADEFSLDINPTQYAFFLLASIEGGFSMAKAMQSKAALGMVIKHLISSLDSYQLV